MVEQKDKIIFPEDAPVEYREDIKGWVYDGHYYGKDERAARWAGSTHSRCVACGEAAVKCYTLCPCCSEKRHKDRYAKMPSRRLTQADEMVYSHTHDEWIPTEDIDEYCELHGCSEKDLMLETTKPVMWSDVIFNSIEDVCRQDWPEDVEPPADIEKAFDELTKVVNACRDHPAWWTHGGESVEPLDEDD